MDCENFDGIIIDPDLPLISSEILNEVLGSESNIRDLDKVTSRPKFSCWDVLDPALFEVKIPRTDHRIYVHGEVLEWIVEYINENMLDENFRATVEEVHHHNLNGPVYSINFYIPNKSISFVKTVNKTELISIRNRFKYNMPWKTNPTYFLRIDSKFNDYKEQIMDQLKQQNLDKCLHARTLDVNWLYIPKIEVYEFSEFLPNERIAEIDSIFEKMSNAQAELYICDQFIWHRYVYTYIEVDKVAMDMCVEEWSRYDLLKDFSIEDILRIDLANKDYRDPYMNGYLDRYLNNLLKKSLPQITSEHERNIDVPLVRFLTYIRVYFISRFHDKISSFITRDYHHKRITIRHYDYFDKPFYKYDIPLIRMEPEIIVLNGECPSAEEVISKFSIANTTYEILNYAHFSNSVFRMLLNKYSWQHYKIRFDHEFNFNYECNKQYSFNGANYVNWISNRKTIKIELQNCIAQNVEKLVNFVKYLIHLFTETRSPTVKVSLYFTNCALDDYTFLENIGNGINEIKFKKMTIPSRQIQVLSRVLTQQRRVKFRNCSDITDNNVMTLLENLQFENLWIEGKNACTPGIYFRLAEYLMNMLSVDTIKATVFGRNMLYTKYNFYYNFKEIEFFNDGFQIVARNRRSKETVDIYRLINEQALKLKKSSLTPAS